MSSQTDEQLEDLLRATFRTQQSLVRTRPGWLATTVLAHRDRRRMVRRNALAFAAMVLVVGLGVPALLRATHIGSTDTGPTGTSSAQAAPPTFWQQVGYLGVQFQIPSDWRVTGTACASAAAAVLVLTVDAQACGRQEPSTRNVAYLTSGGDPVQPAGGPVTTYRMMVSGVPAIRADGRLPDGRYAAWVAITSVDVTLSVHADNEVVTDLIVGSLALPQAADGNGCPTGTPTARPSTEPAPQHRYVPVGPAWAQNCRHGDRLPAGARLFTDRGPPASRGQPDTHTSAPSGTVTSSRDSSQP